MWRRGGEGVDSPVWQPNFVSIALEPNPAKVGGAVTIRVKVLDALGGEQAEAWYSGELMSGEV